MEDIIGWLLGSVAIVVGTLAAAVSTLWAKSEQKNAEQIKLLIDRVERCEVERAELYRELARVEERLKMLEKHDRKDPSSDRD